MGNDRHVLTDDQLEYERRDAVREMLGRVFQSDRVILDGETVKLLYRAQSRDGLSTEERWCNIDLSKDLPEDILGKVTAARAQQNWYRMYRDDQQRTELKRPLVGSAFTLASEERSPSSDDEVDLQALSTCEVDLSGAVELLPHQVPSRPEV